MNKITEFQAMLLDNLEEDGEWAVEDSNGPEKRSLNILFERGMVGGRYYANGEHVYLTEKGLEFVEEYRDR